MQTNVNPNLWTYHHAASDGAIRALSSASSPKEKRMLFPFRAIVLKDVMGFKEGTIFQFARTAAWPSPYPIEIFIQGTGFAGSGSKRFNSKEVRLEVPLEVLGFDTFGRPELRP